ncbi:hypothetical protein MSPP1_001002 [Malassezia sp. CBS 17886]|nr:hypothetical protein MSPP1_001002 [Malassezia sp. CBS 17886]
MGPAHRRRVCAECGSTRFRLVASQLVCAAGHVQRGFRVETAHEDDGFTTQITTRARAIRRHSQRAAQREDRIRRRRWERRELHGRTALVVPGSREHRELANPGDAQLCGARAIFAALQCFQVLLRLQLDAACALYAGVDRAWLEGTARELWGLHVSGHRSVRAAPFDAACAAAARRGAPLSPTLHPYGTHTPDDRGTQQLSGSNAAISIRSTVAVLYLALVVCRIPVTLGEIRSHIHSRALPFLNALRVLPPSLTRLIPETEIGNHALDTSHIPSVTELHARVNTIAVHLHRDYGVEFPEVNAAPLLSRLVDAMCLPASFYVATKSVLSYLQIDMHIRNVSVALPPALRARVQSRDSARDGAGSEGGAGERHGIHYVSRNSTVPRCVMLMGALLVVVKMRWGLDGLDRVEATRPFGGRVVESGVPQFQRWLAAASASAGLAPQDADAAEFVDACPSPPFCPWDADVDLLGLSDAQVDTYLDFLEREYMPKNIPESMRNVRDDALPAWATMALAVYPFPRPSL